MTDPPAAFLRDQILYAAMRVISRCPSCSVLKPCDDPWHAYARAELSAWAERYFSEHFAPTFKFAPFDVGEFRPRYGRYWLLRSCYPLPITV